MNVSVLRELLALSVTNVHLKPLVMTELLAVWTVTAHHKVSSMETSTVTLTLEPVTASPMLLDVSVMFVTMGSGTILSVELVTVILLEQLMTSVTKTVHNVCVSPTPLAPPVDNANLELITSNQETHLDVPSVTALVSRLAVFPQVL